MGQAIYYCCRCSNQLREAQFEAGKAYRIDDLVCCSSCVQEVLRSLSPGQAQRLQAQVGRQEKHAAPVKPPLRESSRAMPLSRPAASPAVRPWMIAAGAAAGILLILLVVLAAGGRSKKVPAGAVAPPAEPPSVDVPKAETPGPMALRKARRFAQDHPEDLEGQLRAFEEAAFKDDKGEAGEAARKAMAAVRERQREAAKRAGAALDARIADPLGREDFAGALRLVEEAKPQTAGAAWRFVVEERERDVRDRMARAFEALKEKAREAKSKGNRAELDVLTDQARRWGVPSLMADFESFLATVPDPPPPAAVLDDFERDAKGWAFTNGGEFPGAKGSFTVEPSAGRDGKGAGRLDGDFTGGGAYVGIWKNLPTRPDGQLKEVRFWAKTGTANRYMVRVGDASSQCLQRKYAIAPSSDWQELVIRFAGFSGAEHWGGANDGKFHAPAKGFGIHLVRDGFAEGGLKGELWIDDVHGVYEAKADR